MTAKPNSSQRPARAGGPKLRVLTDWSDFEKLRAPWDELVDASGAGLFVSHDWLSIWAGVYGKNLAPLVPQVWRDGVLVAAAPCCLSQHKVRRIPFGPTVRCLSMLSNKETPHSHFLAAPGHADALAEILEAIAGKAGECDMCELEPYPDGSGLDVLSDCAADLRFAKTWCETGSSVTVDISCGWEEYLAGRSKSARKRIRREQRALEAVEHRWIRGTECGPGLLDRVFEVSRKSWKGRAGTSIASTEDHRALYGGLWERFGPEGKMELNLLEINGVGAGCLIAIRHKDVVYGMKIDFDEDFAEYSPGRLMVADFLERSAAAGAREVDMLRRSRFTGEFSNDGYGLGRLQLFPRRNLPALWYGLQDKMRPIGRGWRRRRRRARTGREAHAQKGGTP
jgi:CelD/BcsL family acetyltransferase involved in cellulose biosynthesis